MASDLGEAVKRLGPTRIYIVSAIVGGVGDDLHLLVRYRLIIGERQRSNIKRRIPGPHVIRDVWFAITGEGKLAGVQALTRGRVKS